MVTIKRAKTNRTPGGFFRITLIKWQE